MASTSKLSDVAKNYLCRFYEILDEMIEGISEAELTDSLSHNFIVQMIPHHCAAIKMSDNILQYTTFIPLQNIAKNIIVSQTKSIENMQAILPCCSQCLNSVQDICLYKKGFRTITQTMYSAMQNACADNNINADFMREMIPHHKGAIQMSKNALQYPICPELEPILRAIITSQENGVREMEWLLRCACC